MATVHLSARDADLIARVVATEVPPSIARSNPREYERMVGAVVDTVLNRTSTGKYGHSVKDVLNERRAFSKITGPQRLDPYGSVQKAPKASADVRQIVDKHLARRAAGMPSTIGGAVNYANPNFSDRRNLLDWINPMIAAGAQKLGIGKAVHYHGTAPTAKAANPYNVTLPADYFPRIDGAPRRYNPTPPTPTSRPQRPMDLAVGQSMVADPARRATPISAAPAGNVRRAPIGAPKPSPLAPAPVGRVERMALPAIAPTPKPAVDPAKLAAAYQQYGASRMAGQPQTIAPLNPAPVGQVTRAPLQAPTMPAPVATKPTLSQVAVPVTPAPVAVPPPPVTAPKLVAPQPPVPSVDAGFPAAPQRPPAASPMDVYRGLAPSAMSASGNQVSRDQFGNTSVTNRFGATTTTLADGSQAASRSPIAGPLGQGGGILGSGQMGGMFEPKAELSGRSQFGNAARGLGGGVAGAGLGGLLAGPLGAALGAALGRELSKPGGGRIGEMFGGGGNNFATPDQVKNSGGSFATVPVYGGGTYSGWFPAAPPAPQQSYSGGGAISDQARDAVSRGGGGLY